MSTTDERQALPARGTCSVPTCDEPKGAYAGGYPQSMCETHTRAFDSFRRDLAKRQGSSRGAARAFYDAVVAEASDEDRA